jgi:hypothetical protein
MGGWGGGRYWPQGVPSDVRRRDEAEERRRKQSPDAPDTTDQLARSYANLRFECADLEAIIGADHGGLSDKELKRLDKAVTVMKVAFKIVAKVLRKHGYETGRKRLASAGEAGTAETPKSGSVHEHAAPEGGDAHA